MAFFGNIISISPSKIAVGDPIKLVIDYHIETTSLAEKLNGWFIGVDVESSYFSTVRYVSGLIFGGGGNGRTVIFVDTMPPYPIYFTVKLFGNVGKFIIGSAPNEVVDMRTHYIEATPSGIPGLPPPGEPPPPEEEPPPGNGFELPEWAIPAIIGGVVLLFVLSE